MTIKQLHTTLLITLCAALAACSERGAVIEPTGSETTDGKTPIVLSVGGVDAPAATRAASPVITNDPTKEYNPFDKNTKIFMIMKSEYVALTGEYAYMDYGGTEKGEKYTVARGDVTANTNKVVFDTNNQRYWDDAHARSSKLNIWAYAQKGMDWTECSFAVDDSGKNPPYKKQPYQTSNKLGWGTTPIYPMIFNWNASYLSGSEVNKQNETTVMCQDLLFSNNLVNNSASGTHNGGSDNRLAFDPSTRKFPTEGNAHMYFYHAMSKITIKIVKGEGFTSEFNFPENKNVKLTGFNTEGLFSIQMGGFQQINASADIPSIYLKSTTPKGSEYYTLEALAVPNIDDFMQTWSPAQHDANSRFVSGKKDPATDVMMEFTINNNKYQITSGQLYDALMQHDGDGNETTPVTNAIKKTNNGTYIPLEAGKNYVFTFTVGKTKINNITAQVADWENVNAEPQNFNNARIKLQLEERGTAQTSDVAFYKKDDHKTTEGIDDDYATYNWKTGYSNMNATYSDNHWTTNLFWNSNKEFYHFRALMPAATGVTTDGSGDGDYVTLASASNYTDVRWGAPFKDDGDNETSGNFQWTYNLTTGFDNSEHTQIYKAIGATEDPVKLILFHMMSDVTFNITTTTGDDKVDLGDGSSNKTKVELVDYKTGGKLLLGNGLVTATGDAATAEIAQKSFTAEVGDPATEAAKAVFTYGAVPQSLENVKLRITTPDNNKYEVDLNDVKATTISTNNIVNPYQQSGGKYTIDRWYPGFKYTYSFTLKKTGITNLSATIVQWETVEADNEGVQIK